MNSRINRLQGEEGSARTSQFRYGRQNAVTSLMKKAGAVGLSGALIFSCTPAYAVEDDSASSVDNVIGVSSTDEISLEQKSEETIDNNESVSSPELESQAPEEESSEEENRDIDALSEGSDAFDVQSGNSMLQVASVGGDAYEQQDENVTVIASGTVGGYGNKTKWTLTSDRVLEFSIGTKILNGQTKWVKSIMANLSSGPITVKIGEGVTMVQSSSFTGLSSDYSLNFELPDSCTKFEVPASQIASVSGGGKLLDGDLLFYDSAHTTIQKCFATSGDITIPAGVTAIRSGAFSGESYGTISIPASLCTFDISAFSHASADNPICDKILLDEGNPYLEVKSDGSLYRKDSGSLLIPARSSEYVDSFGVVYTSDRTFLKSATSATNLPSDYAVDEKCTTIGASAFKGCSSIVSVSGENVETIENEAFSDCGSLSKAVFPKVKAIRSNAFSGTSNLKTVDLAGVESIESGAFANSGIDSFIAPATLTTLGSAVFKGSKLQNVDLKSASIAELPSAGFSNCESLQSLEIPEGLSKIGFQALSGCTSLTEIDFSNSEIEQIAQSAFSGCTSLQSVKLPSTVRLDLCGMQMFDGCTSLESIDLSNLSPSNMPESTFANCTSLKSVKLPDGIKALPGRFFENCTSLSEYVIPDGVSSVGMHCFEGCSSLAKLAMPESLRSIGAGALAKTALTEFVAPAYLWLNEDGTSKILNSFNKDSADISNTAAMFTSTPAAIMGQDGWETAWSSISKVDLFNYSAEFIPAYMFMGLNQMTEIEIPNSVREIDSGAFFGCMSLKKVFCFNQNVNIAGASEYGDPTLGWSVETPPAFAAWQKQSDDSYETKALTGIKFYGLAYGSNNLISYCQTNDCTFVPFVVLGGYDTTSKFGFKISGYNNLKIADMVYTGQALSPEIRVSFTDRNGVADRVLTDQDADIVYKDAGGNTLRTIVAPGTYTAEITGHEDEGVYGTQTVTFRVVDPNQQSGGQQSGSQQPVGQQLMQQVNQQTAMPQTGDNAASAAVPATTAAIGALGALGIALAALRRKFGKDSE